MNANETSKAPLKHQHQNQKAITGESQTKIAQKLFEKYDAVAFVEGLVCSFCAQGIQKTFQKDPSIAKVTVDLEDSTLSLKFKKKRKLSPEQIKKKVESAGYDVNSIYIK